MTTGRERPTPTGKETRVDQWVHPLLPLTTSLINTEWITGVEAPGSGFLFVIPGVCVCVMSVWGEWIRTQDIFVYTCQRT